MSFTPVALALWLLAAAIGPFFGQIGHVVHLTLLGVFALALGTELLGNMARD